MRLDFAVFHQVYTAGCRSTKGREASTPALQFTGTGSGLSLYGSQCGPSTQPCGGQPSMSRSSSSAKRYMSPPYVSHYGAYSSPLAPYSEQERLPYKSAPSSYTSPSYLSTSTGRDRHCSASPEPDRGRPLPRADLLGPRRSESLSRAPARDYAGPVGLNGGACYPSFPCSPVRPGHLPGSPAASPRLTLSRRRSVSQTDLTRDMAFLALADCPASPTSSLRCHRQPESPRPCGWSQAGESRELYDGGGYGSGYALSRSSTQEALSSGSSRFWERPGTARSSSPTLTGTTSSFSPPAFTCSAYPSSSKVGGRQCQAFCCSSRASVCD